VRQADFSKSKVFRGPIAADLKQQIDQWLARNPRVQPKHYEERTCPIDPSGSLGVEIKVWYEVRPDLE
jgi:hypothetical protein